MQDYNPNFSLSVTVMLLFTEFPSTPDDKSIGTKYCQKQEKKKVR